MHTVRNLLALGSAFIAFSANAATICVNPAGGCPHTIIQTAVTAAAAGDTIKIAAGKYQEEVTVPAGKDGLILMGSGATKTIIDPNLNPDGTDENGLIIQSNNVQVIGIGIHNTDGDGIFVASANGLIMKKSVVQNADEDCVDIDAGAGEVFEGNRFASCSGNGVEVTTDPAGAGAVFKKNRMVNGATNGFAVTGTGTGPLFEGNSCEMLDDDCINVSGNGAIVKKNSSRAVTGQTVDVDGAGALIEGNKSVGGGGVVEVTGDNPRVLKNSATDSDVTAIFLDCDDSSCTTALVEGNRVKTTSSDADCFDLDFEFPGGIVRKNTATNCSDEGLEISSSPAATVTVEGNTAIRAGTSSGNGIDVDGTGIMTLRGNKVSRAGGDGIDVSDAPHVLEKNSVKNNAENGIFVQSTVNGAQLTANDASGNGEEGIQNSGDNTVLNKNKAKNNSPGQDFCNSTANATGTVLGVGENANTFGSTATVCINE